MQRDVSLVAYYPTIVRPRRNVEQRSWRQFNALVFTHRRDRASRHHQPNVFDLAVLRSGDRCNVYGPFPARLVSGTTDGQSANVNNLKLALLENTRFVWCFKTF